MNKRTLRVGVIGESGISKKMMESVINMNKVDAKDVLNAKVIMESGNEIKWVTEDCIGIKIKDMSYVHLVNLLKYLTSRELGISNLTDMAFINVISREIIVRGQLLWQDD